MAEYTAVYLAIASRAGVLEVAFKQARAGGEVDGLVED